MTIAKKEYFVLTGILIIFLILLGPQLLSSRAKVRDGIRKQDVSHIKHSLEMYFNELEYYPQLDGKECISSTSPDAWPFVDVLPHDLKEDRGYDYQYCVTQRNEEFTTGYFIQARLENKYDNIVEFDEDERRKYDYRILNENDASIYRVCGGEETQCQT